jgi:hypothetical protein
MATTKTATSRMGTHRTPRPTRHAPTRLTANLSALILPTARLSRITRTTLHYHDTPASTASQNRPRLGRLDPSPRQERIARRLTPNLPRRCLGGPTMVVEDMARCLRAGERIPVRRVASLHQEGRSTARDQQTALAKGISVCRPKHSTVRRLHLEREGSFSTTSHLQPRP